QLLVGGGVPAGEVDLFHKGAGLDRPGAEDHGVGAGQLLHPAQFAGGFGAGKGPPGGKGREIDGVDLLHRSRSSRVQCCCSNWAKAGRRAKAAAVMVRPPPISSHRGKRYQNRLGTGPYSRGSSAMPTTQIRAALGRARLMRRLSLSRSRLRAYTKRPNRAKLPPSGAAGRFCRAVSSAGRAKSWTRTASPTAGSAPSSSRKQPKACSSPAGSSTRKIALSHR